jgi:hypothetical protein
MQEFTAKSSSLFTFCPETPINRAFQGVKSYLRLFTHSSPRHEASRRKKKRKSAETKR